MITFVDGNDTLKMDTLSSRVAEEQNLINEF